MRLEEKFKKLKQENKKAFIAYVPFGFPEINMIGDICLTLQEAGVDAIEVGIPFSDPLADGPIIQKATNWALNKGANVDLFFEEFSKFNKKLTIPIVIMSYYNPILQFGLKDFFKQMNSLDISAIIIVDLPLEESQPYIKEARKWNIDNISFITPTTSRLRVKKIIKYARGFIYYVSVTGITGPRDLSYSQLSKHIKNIKQNTAVPICVGFGIHNSNQVCRINKFSDGVIVGSEIVRFIENNYCEKNFLNKLKTHTKNIISR